MRSAMASFLDNSPGEAVAFAPAMEPLAARVGGMSYQAMSNDAAQWSSALAKTGHLLKTDALILGFDHTLLAQACGAKVQWQTDQPVFAGVEALPSVRDVISGRLETSIEALNRLCQTAREIGRAHV